ncbi:MAG: DNA gyrase subunit A [Gammaproteobacteria bacterium]|nr:MAG: DNA gyrase subunit A [Gammaproteobacteria bacterium]
MVDLAKEILPINIEDELKTSYLDYAMSVIVGRALPDVRDGLKPVHRRSLYAMSVLGNSWNKPYKKSARIVGDVIGKYHPHGDTAVYDTIVRMAQPFSMRYMLVDGQGNFGSVDGDSPAAMRYTEVRMSKLAHELLSDLEKETVDFDENYDGTESEPSVMPTRVPTLLVNGSSGIAVGMATNFPPHNLTEVINGCMAVMDNPEIDVEGLMEHIPGPDFPTAAIINGRAGIVEAYKTGRGRIYMRSVSHVETNESNGKQSIVVTELPYQVNKARLIEKIADLVKDKKIEGITGLRDESDKDGMRMVVELRRGEVPEVILNNLFAQTQMQTVFGINMVALQNRRPRLFNLKETLEAFIQHRQEVVTRRTIYDLRKAREKAHILEGQAIALANIEPVIALIRASNTPVEAREGLLARGWELGHVASMLEKAGSDAARPDGLPDEMGIRDNLYYLSPEQAQSILDMRLQKLTGLEHDKILNEYQELLVLIEELLFILASKVRLMEVIREELEEIKENFGDARRTEIYDRKLDLSIEDLITETDVVVTLSNEGYVKYQPLELYKSQRRGGRGKASAKMKEEDFIRKLLVTSTHDTIMCFSSRGKVYWLKVFELPEAGRNARGKPIVNLLPLEDNETITAILPLRSYEEEMFIFMATSSGTVKKTALSSFARQRSTGLIALALADDDHLVGVDITDGNSDIMLFSDAGKVIRFNENHVRSMGRTARGVRGIRLKDAQKMIGMVVAPEEGQILTATVNGFGKRTDINDYPVRGRGGQGVISISVSERNGQVINAVSVIEDDEIMLITDRGTLVRTRVTETRIMGRNTQGVRLIRLTKGESLVALQRVDEIVGDEDDDEEIIPTDGTVSESSESIADDVNDAEDTNDTNDADDADDADDSEDK